MNRWVTASVLVTLVLSTFGIVATSAFTDEPDSAFTGGEGAAVVDAARTRGVPVERFSSQLSALVHDAEIPPEETLLVAVSPSEPYTEQEIEDITEFVEAGGSLLVVDSFGYGGMLTAPFGIGFERVRMVEPSPAWSTTVAGYEYEIIPDRPTSLRIASNADAEVLAWSSSDSFIDRDGDGIIEASEPIGPFPVFATTVYGLGKVWALSDAGAVADSADPAWLRNLMGVEQIFMEESGRTTDPMLGILAALRSAASTSPWQYILIGGAIVTLGAQFAPHILTHWKHHRFNPNRFTRRNELHEEDAREAPLVHWTSRGVTALIAAGSLGAFALVTGSLEAAFASTMLMAVLGMATWPRSSRVQAIRLVSVDRLHEGAKASVNIDLRSVRGRIDAEIRDELPVEFEVTDGTPWSRAVLARKPLKIEYEVSPALRGPYQVGPLRVRRQDALRLRVQDTIVTHPAPMRVYPHQEDVRQIPFRTRVPTITLGPHMVNRAGEGSEFHALRQYTTGDSFRSVNWKASARSKDLMVNQRVHESMTTLTIFLDARKVSAAGPASKTPLAHGCRTALSVAAGALRVRDRLRVVFYGSGVKELPNAPGSRQLHELSEVLSDLDADGNTPFIDAVNASIPNLKPGTPVMLASGLEADPTIADGLRLLRGRGMMPFVVAAPIGVEPVDPKDGPAEPNATKLLDQRESTIKSLQSLGIPVYDAIPGMTLDYLFRLGGPA